MAIPHGTSRTRQDVHLVNVFPNIKIFWNKNVNLLVLGAVKTCWAVILSLYVARVGLTRAIYFFSLPLGGEGMD